jgi:hypothetical protein
MNLLDTKLDAKKIDNGRNNGGDVYLVDNVVYKSFLGNTCFITEKCRNVQWFKNNKIFKPYILEMFYDKNEFIGYSQEYIQNAKSFKEGINDSTLSYDFKIKIIRDIFDKLRLLHNNGFFYGDIHLENVCYNEEEGFLLDLDEVRLKDVDDFKFSEYYNIRRNQNSPAIKVASKYTDNVKMAIVSLSILYNFNFEEILKKSNLKEVKKYIDCFIEDSELKCKIYDLFDKEDRIDEEFIYFDDILLSDDNKILMKENV